MTVGKGDDKNEVVARELYASLFPNLALLHLPGAGRLLPHAVVRLPCQLNFPLITFFLFSATSQAFAAITLDLHSIATDKWVLPTAAGVLAATIFRGIDGLMLATRVQRGREQVATAILSC